MSRGNVNHGTEHMKVYLDSCILIYLLEGEYDFRTLITEKILDNANIEYCISLLTRMECRVGPLREGNLDLLEEYDELFDSMTILDLNADVFDKAADLRAKKKIRTPDALHIACASIHGCGEFWTNDERLGKKFAMPILKIIS